MAITVKCPNPACGVSSSVADDITGRNVKCKKCGQPFIAKPTLVSHKPETKQSQPAAAANPFPALPAEFGRYRVLKLLGKGGMGAVYLAEDSQLGRQVALKMLFVGPGGSNQRVERFVREARSAAVLQHPNICTLFDAGQIDNRPFLTMAYIAGKPLEDEIDPDAPVPQIRAAEIVRKIAQALDHAHRKGIVHRDLKPANVMMTPEGEPVVMDFGLAKRVAEVDSKEAKLTRDGGILGTPSYMAPEQVKGEVQSFGPPMDIYSLGVMLFEMLTGNPPFTGAVGVVMAQILVAPVPRAQELRPEIDARLDAICHRAMQKDPAARFPSMADFATALGEYLQAPAPPPPPLPIPSPTNEQPIRSPRKKRPSLDKQPRRSKGKLSPSRQRQYLVAGLVALTLLLLVPLVYWLALVVFRVETPNGTLVVEFDGDEVGARIKNGKLILSGPDGKDRYTLTPTERTKELEANPYKIRVEGADGLVLDTPEFTIKKGKQVTVHVTLDPKKDLKKDPDKIAQNPPQPNAGQEGFVSLFNGKDLTGWAADGDCADSEWKADANGIAIKGGSQKSWGFLLSKQDYTNFVLRLQFQQSTEGAKSGIILRGVPGRRIGNLPYQCKVNLQNPQNTGAFLWSDKSGYQNPIRQAKLKPAGEWNDVELELRGQALRVTINGDVVQNLDINSFADKPNALEALKLNSGRVGLQKHEGSVSFRNIEIRELKGDAEPPSGNPSDLKPPKEEIKVEVKNTPPSNFPSDLKVFKEEDKVDVKSTPAPSGAKVLFAGKSLDGWVREDGKTPADWALVAGDAVEVRQGNIQTKDHFDGAFHLHVEFRVPYLPNKTGQARGNSGIYLQGRYELQVLDSYGLKSSNVGCGSIYGQAAPLVNACKAPTIWQSYDVEYTSPVFKDGKKTEGTKITIYQNGVKIHDNLTFPLNIDGTAGSVIGDPSKPGPIVLQAHGDAVQFRNIWLLPLKKESARTLPDARGFVSLFNGTDLTGWTLDCGTAEQWKVEDGHIKGSRVGAGPRSWLLSDQQYENFVLNLEFQIAPEADGAVGIRAMPKEIVGGIPHHLAIKLTGYTKPTMPQIGAFYYWPNTWQQPSKPARVVPKGNWNKLTIQLQGDELRVSVNGQEVQKLQLDTFAKMANVPPGTKRSTGRIGLQQHTGEIRFRNIEIKELPTAGPK